MQKPELDFFNSYLDGLVAATRSGSIEWEKVNPTTYTWSTKVPTSASVSLQIVESKKRLLVAGGSVKVETIANFIFQVGELSPSGLTLNIKLLVNTSEEPETKPKLEELYGAITSGESRSGLEFLKSILPSPPSRR